MEKETPMTVASCEVRSGACKEAVTGKVLFTNVTVSLLAGLFIGLLYVIYGQQTAQANNLANQQARLAIAETKIVVIDGNVTSMRNEISEIKGLLVDPKTGKGIRADINEINRMLVTVNENVKQGRD